MREFHAWIGLTDATDEGNRGVIEREAAKITTLLGDADWHDAAFDLKSLNGQYFLTVTGYVNRRREEGDLLDLLLATISRRLPGSWGLVYERDDEMPATFPVPLGE